MVELKNQLKLIPQLILTPQLKLLLRILQLNTLELEQYLIEEAQVNPFLELEYNDLSSQEISERSKFYQDEIKLVDEIDLSNEEFLERSLRMIEPVEEDDQPLWMKTLKAEEKLSDYLLWQVRMKEITPTEYEIALHIIGNLDEKGYLKIKAEEISKELGVSENKVEKVRNIIKFLDPVGVASYNIKECLLTQLEYLGYNSETLVYKLVKDHLENIPQGIDYLSQELKVERETIEEALYIIKKLEPYPARNFYSESSIYIEPDLIFYKQEDEWKVEVVKEKNFRIKLNEFYKEFLKMKKRDPYHYKSRQFLKEKLKDAENLLKALDSRYTSLYKVGETILKHQKEFLEKGIKYLKPLNLKMIAEEVQLHESTISRIVSHKYVQTPLGVFPLKFFFSSGYSTSHGEAISSKAVKDLIVDIIKQEDPKKPYSDAKIAEILREKYGIKIARRTVTKYREELEIPSVRERKKTR